jgi:hypothetical protein
METWSNTGKSEWCYSARWKSASAHGSGGSSLNPPNFASKHFELDIDKDQYVCKKARNAGGRPECTH